MVPNSVHFSLFTSYFQFYLGRLTYANSRAFTEWNVSVRFDVVLVGSGKSIWIKFFRLREVFRIVLKPQKGDDNPFPLFEDYVAVWQFERCANFTNEESIWRVLPERFCKVK